MTREEANARLAVIANEVETLLNEAKNLAVLHSLTFNATLSEGYTTTHIDISRYGTLETWETSDEVWDDSGCGDWDDSGC
jgi:hypothetical protein